MKCSYLEAARRRTRAAPSKAWSQGTPCEQEQTTKMLAMLSTLSAPQQLSQNVTQQITLLLSSCHCIDDVVTRRMMAARCTLRSEDRNRLVAFMKQMLPPQGRRAQTPCVDSQMHTQKRRSQSLGGVHKTYAALQERCAQTPCVGSHMHTQKRRSQSLGGIHKSNSALQGRCAQTPCGGSHMHTQKRRSQSLGGIHKTNSALQGRCAQTPCGSSRMHTQRRRSQSPGGIHKTICCPTGTMCTDTV